jgi:putative autotransporter adhesin-like protein
MTMPGPAMIATVLLAGATAMAAPTVAAAAELRIRDAIADVTIIPEARSDFAAVVTRPNARLPAFRIVRTPQGLLIDGGLERRINNCGMMGGIKVKNGPRIPRRDAPQITIRTPLDVAVVADGHVRGSIGASRSLSLTTEGCGGWSVGDVAQKLDIHLEGLGDVKAGRTRSLAVSLEGLGDVDVVSVSGPVDASVEGMGSLRIKGGRAATFRASLDGMGSIRFDGTAESVDASADGMGSIRVARATGQVHKTTSGLARIKVGD